MESAVERFLGRGTDAVDKTAQQVLEGALRGVVATVSPEDANAKRLELATEVARRAREELSRLGIVLDFFQIQNISDDRGYLEAIGRKRNAEVLRDAQIAEALGRNASVVRAKREELGLPRQKRLREDPIDWDEQPLGQMPDYEIARRLGVTRARVLRARQALGIPAYKGPYQPPKVANIKRRLTAL